MKYKEFLEYMECHLEGYQTFMRKARQFQSGLNANRKKENRWPEERIERVSYDMWKKAMENLYNKLKNKIKSESRLEWTSFIEKNDIFEIVNESISEMDFSDGGA